MAETKCYMIVLAALTDRERFTNGYAKEMVDLIPKFGGRYVLRGRDLELLEGEWGDGGSMIISEWPSREAANTMWHSPEYTEVKKLREGTGQFHVVLVDAPQING